MEVALTPKPRQAAKREIVRQFEHGVSAEDVRGRSPVPMHRTTIYRLLKRVYSKVLIPRGLIGRLGVVESV